MHYVPIILQQVVALELDAGLDLAVDSILVPLHLGEILVQAVLVHALDFALVVDAALGLGQDFDIQVAGQDAMAHIRGHFLHDDGQRIWLSPDRAACAPDIELRRALQEVRNDIRLQLAELLRRAEEL